MATSLRTKRRIFDLNRLIPSMLNKASNFDHKYDISFSPTQYLKRIKICDLQVWWSPRKIRQAHQQIKPIGTHKVNNVWEKRSSYCSCEQLRVLFIQFYDHVHHLRRKILISKCARSSLSTFILLSFISINIFCPEFNN